MPKDKDKYKGRPRKAAKTATAKKYGSNKKSTKELLNQLSINKKPKKNVTNDLDVARLINYTSTKKPKKSVSEPKVTSSASVGTSTGAEKKVSLKIANPENNSKSISSPSNNTKGQESISNTIRKLNEIDTNLVDTKEYSKRQLEEEWLKKMKDLSYYRGR